jgi:VanZ family protein
VILWIVALFILSTSLFSASETSKFIVPVLQWLFPAASAPTVYMMHTLIRKGAHFTNYGILFWLLIRGPMYGRPYAALALCVCYAFLDEGHQVLAVGRTPSLSDVALDGRSARSTTATATIRRRRAIFSTEALRRWSCGAINGFKLAVQTRDITRDLMTIVKTPAPIRPRLAAQPAMRKSPRD